MVDLSVNNNMENANLLLKGFWYSNLPDIIDINELVDDIEIIFDKLNNKEHSIYKYTGDFITGWDNNIVNSPKYIFSPGVEVITFYDFKKNKSLREMQIPNLIYYLSFVYNTMVKFYDIFDVLYMKTENKSVIQNSISYLVFEDVFAIYSYDEVEDWAIVGTFTTQNNKIFTSAMIEENKKRILKAEKDYLYSLKMDIESFFPNLYTHNLERIASKFPFNTLVGEDEYFKFLDLFNRRINGNQTKGIPAGIFSSHIAAELCMLCVDDEIKRHITDTNLDIEYIRYVDDLTFFSDSKTQLSELLPIVQNILSKYTLRINGNKTESVKSVFIQQHTYIQEIEKNFAYLTKESVEHNFTLNDFFELKKYISVCLQEKRTSQIRTLLSLFYNKLEQEKLSINELQEEVFYYFIKLIFADVQLASHLYKIIDFLLSANNKEEFQNVLQKKKEKIDAEFPDTIIQIWHYYLIFKYCDDAVKNAILDNLGNRRINPVVITCMVSLGDNLNAKIFNYIKNSYINETHSTNWQKEILFSRWWLPLFKIKRYDSFDYDGFMNSENFIDVFNDFSKH